MGGAGLAGAHSPKAAAGANALGTCPDAILGWLEQSHADIKPKLSTEVLKDSSHDNQLPGESEWVKPLPAGLAHTSYWFDCGCGTWQSCATLCCLLFLTFPLERVHGVSAVPADLIRVMVRLSWW